MESGIIKEWFVTDGDYVKENDTLFSMETDKVVVEVTSPTTGFITIAQDKSDDEIPVGEVVAYIHEQSTLARIEIPNKKAPIITSQDLDKEIKNLNGNSYRIIASPYARKLARENNIDLSKIKGTAANGRIIAPDVLAHLKKQNDLLSTPNGNNLDDSTNAANIKRSIEISLTPMRKKIVNVIEQSANSIIPVTITKTVRVDKLVQLRNEMKQEGINFTPNDFIIFSVSRSLQKFRSFNSQFSTSKIIEYQNINVSFAVAVENGVIMPVIHDADKKSITEIAIERKQLIEDVRNHKISKKSLEDGTFSISSLGEYGIDHFSPVVYPTQSAIIGIGSIQKAPVIEGDQIQIGYLLSLSIVFDHRVNDGAIGAEFLQEICSRLERPLKTIFSS